MKSSRKTGNYYEKYVFLQAILVFEGVKFQIIL